MHLLVGMASRSSSVTRQACARLTACASAGALLRHTQRQRLEVVAFHDMEIEHVEQRFDEASDLIVGPERKESRWLVQIVRMNAFERLAAVQSGIEKPPGLQHLENGGQHLREVRVRDMKQTIERIA